MKYLRGLGPYLKGRREDAGLSQKDVSEELGYSTPQFVSNWERGLCSPPVKVMRKIASLYKIPSEEMFKLLMKEMEAELREQYFGASSSKKKK